MISQPQRMKSIVNLQPLAYEFDLINDFSRLICYQLIFDTRSRIFHLKNVDLKSELGY